MLFELKNGLRQKPNVELFARFSEVVETKNNQRNHIALRLLSAMLTVRQLVMRTVLLFRFLIF